MKTVSPEDTTIAEKILEAECHFRKRLKKKRDCENGPRKVPPKRNVQHFVFNDNNATRAAFRLDLLDPQRPTNFLLGVIPLDIDITASLSNQSSQETDLIFTSTLPLQNVKFYSVLGFDQFDATSDDDVFVDLGLQVGGNWTISSLITKQTIQTFLSDNHLSSSAIKNATLKCVFIDIDTNSYSEEGCESVSSPDLNQVFCNCSHATVFTIVLSVSVKKVPYAVQV